jgi:hypothetical protein
MDTKKDIQKTENISHFVDKQTIKTHPFGDNKMGERAYRRAERLVAAIHLLTNHIDPGEPIRRIVRERSATILGDVLDVRDELRTIGSQKIYSIEASIRQLISLVRILAVSGFVSFENADILTDALDDLGSFMETSRRSVLSENIRFSRGDLIDVRETGREYIKDIKDTGNIKDNDIVKDIDSSHKYVRDQKDNRHMNRRMDGILEVLRGGSALNIKEIAVNLPEYSEKMIQRELADLVTMGRVVRIGFRRWSKYALATSERPPAEAPAAADRAA